MTVASAPMTSLKVTIVPKIRRFVCQPVSAQCDWITVPINSLSTSDSSVSISSMFILAFDLHRMAKWFFLTHFFAYFIKGRVLSWEMNASTSATIFLRVLLLTLEFVYLLQVCLICMQTFFLWCATKLCFWWCCHCCELWFVTSLALQISIAFENVKSGMDSSRSRKPRVSCAEYYLVAYHEIFTFPNSHVRALFLNSVTNLSMPACSDTCAVHLQEHAYTTTAA